MSAQNSNRLIVRNTFFMYFRMFITMAIGLYSSRIILNTLGIESYGIYNIVGGVIILFSFISNALRNSTQRFLSFELGRQGKGSLQKIFNAAIQCHIYICIVLLILAETIGLWFTETQLNIPSSQEAAVGYVYQFSVITFILHVLQVPYNSLIISYEKMGFYAYLSIIEAALKLLLLYFLMILPGNKLILYSVLIAIVALIILLAYAFYCHYKLGIKKFAIVHDSYTYRELLGFSGWSMLNGSTSLLSQQGCNYFINIFSGVAANAAYGIANQASIVVYSFVTNFQCAFQPQIVKRYAAGDYNNLVPLIIRSSSLSYYLLLTMVIPFASEAEFILKLWLGIVPDHTVIFCDLILVFFLIDAIQAPLWMLIYGTGNIKLYSIVTGALTLTCLPVSWILLKNGYPVFSIFMVRIIVNILCSIFRMYYVKSITKFPISTYINSVIVRAFFVTLFAIIIIIQLKRFELHPLIVISISIIIVALLTLMIGFRNEDRTTILNLIREKVFLK